MDFSPLLQTKLSQRPLKLSPKVHDDCLPRICATASPLSNVSAITKELLHDKMTGVFVKNSVGVDKLFDILNASKRHGEHTTLPPNDGGLVSVINLTNIPDKPLSLFLSVFTDIPRDTVLNRSEILKHLAQYVPFTSLQRYPTSVCDNNTCATCGLNFDIFHWVHYTCCYCRRPLCKGCPVNIVLSSRLADKPTPLCSNCLVYLNQLDVDDWTNQSVQLIEVGTLETVRAALGCLTIALCLSEFSTKPVIKVAQALVNQGMPELAMSFISVLLEHSENPKQKMRIYTLCAEIFKALANQTGHSEETRWNLLLAAKESCNLALETATSFDNSIEPPALVSVQLEIGSSLNSLREKQEAVQESEIDMICSQMEFYWVKRDWNNILALVTDGNGANVSFLPHKEDKTVVALEHFLTSKSTFVDKMLPDDRCGLNFLEAVIKIQKHRFSDALTDLERLAYDSHYHTWLGSAIADLLFGLITDKYFLLFPSESLHQSIKGKFLMETADDEVNKFCLLFPRTSELTPPFTSRWPELGVVGLNTKGHQKFEKAVVALLNNGQWDYWDVAMAYINYVSACVHPAEAAVCFLYAAMWLLKQLVKSIGSSSAPPLSEIFATKHIIMNCLQSSMGICIRFLHCGMQFYVCRLCLGTALQTMQMTESLAVEYEADLITTLLHVTVYSSRFCPVWYFPSIPLSEVVLLSLKSGRYHLKYLLDLQYVEDDKRPVTLSEMLYQIHENDLRGICPLEDSAGARARAMEEMLREKGWTWNDVVSLMTSPLSPRDSEGWLIQQQTLGISMPFSKLTGFVFNISSESPSIEIVAVPADPSKGLIGMFSMNDVQTVLQLVALDAYPIFFSLDSPSLHQKRHPFQQWRYKPKELQNSSFIHTLFEADYLLKSFSVGAEVSAKPPFKSRPCKEGLTKNLPPDLVEAIKPVPERGPSSPYIHRFWIQADEIEYSVKEMGPRLEFEIGEPQMVIRSHPRMAGPDGWNCDAEFEDDPDSPEAKFVSDLTSHYSELGMYFPIFARLRELTKLQTLVPILLHLKRYLRDKAAGKGLEVPTFLLTEVQQKEHKHHINVVDKILKSIDKDVGIWPAANDQTRIASKVKTIMDSLPNHVMRGASCSDIEPHAKSVLQEEDEKALNDITDNLLELCEQRLPKDNVKESVLKWLMFRNTSTATELRNLICSVLSLPTREDIIREIIQPYHKLKCSAFGQMLDSLTSPQPQQPQNPCMWVPAAVLKDDITVRSYGGVILPFRLLQRRQRSESCSEESSICPTASVPSLIEIVCRLLSVPICVEKAEVNNLSNTDGVGAQELFSPPTGPFVQATPAHSAEEEDQDSKQPQFEGKSQGNPHSGTNCNSNNGVNTATGEDKNSCSKNNGTAQMKSENHPQYHSLSVMTNEFDSEVDECTGATSVPYFKGNGTDSNAGEHDKLSDYTYDLCDIKSDNSSTCDMSDCDSELNQWNGPSVDGFHEELSDISIQQGVSCSQYTPPLSCARSSLPLTPQTDPEPITKRNGTNHTTEHNTSECAYNFNSVVHESTINGQHHPGYGAKALCGDQNLREKSAIPVERAHPGAMYTKLRHNCTQKKHEEVLSVEKESRLCFKGLFDKFFNINICGELLSTTKAQSNEKVGIKGYDFFAAIDKQIGWLSFAMREHSETAKVSEAIKEISRFANANSHCRDNGCQCCDAMVQSNVCIDNDGCEIYRAELSKEVNCRSSNVVYLIRCRRSGKNIYVGQTKEELRKCLDQHRKRQDSTVYKHFTSKGYSFDDMEVMVLADIEDDKVRENKEDHRKKKLCSRKKRA